MVSILRFPGHWTPSLEAFWKEGNTADIRRHPAILLSDLLILSITRVISSKEKSRRGHQRREPSGLEGPKGRVSRLTTCLCVGYAAVCTRHIFILDTPHSFKRYRFSMIFACIAAALCINSACRGSWKQTRSPSRYHSCLSHGSAAGGCHHGACS